MKRPTMPAVLLMAALSVASCTSESPSIPDPRPAPGPTRPTPRIDLDPERYVLDYEESRSGATPSGAPNSGASTPIATDEDGAVPPKPLPPTIDEDNTFVDPGRNPIVETAEQPASTFGLDVDTGSFSVGRTFLSEGQLPPSDSIRTEEWVNALGSAQVAPRTGDLGIAVDGARSPFGRGDTQLVRIGVAARDVDPGERPPANLTFVVDTSGSMDIRDRLGLVKASLGLLVLNLRDDDTIAIVEYSDEAAVVLEPTPVADADTIVAAIDDLQPSNSTNLEAGVRAGYEQAEKAFVADGINTVILASDGVANVGMTGPDGLATMISDRATDGIGLVTVGYGMGNYNDDLMEQLADQGDGFYAYLDTYAQAENLFRDRLTSTLTQVAGDAKAQVTFDPDLVSSYRLIGYENRALNTEDFEDDQVDAGEIGAGHRVTALYEVTLPDFAVEPAPDTILGTAAVRYRSTATGQVTPVNMAITYGSVAGSFDVAPADFRLQGATAAFAEWMDTGGGREDPTLSDIEALAEAAASELAADGLPGSAVTPDAMVELMSLAAEARPAPDGGTIVPGE